MAGSCSSGLGSKSSGSLRLRLELVGAGGSVSVLDRGVCEEEMGIKLRADDGVATVIGTGGALDESGFGVELARSMTAGANEGSLLRGPLDIVDGRKAEAGLTSEEDFDLTWSISGV